MPVRVRFAPSPTGYLHIGGARTALFNWLYARHTGGAFILRIEDTDEARNTQEAVNVILDGMRWLGLDWNEGPTSPDASAPSKGDCGPYFQSQRKGIYARRIAELKEKGMAYERDGAIRFRMTREPILIPDIIVGDVMRPLTDREEQDPDFVIVRSDGQPVFHLVNVIDDLEMNITHVLRGEDHLSNTAKHIALFRAFGVQPPKYGHIPLILNLDGSKMSKRDRGASLTTYMEEGFVPQGVVNYLALLGWSPKNNREKMSVQELITAFDLPHVLHHNAKFDMTKLEWLSGEHLRDLPDDEFRTRAAAALRHAGVPVDAFPTDYVQAALDTCKGKVKKFSELASYAGFYFRDAVNVEADALAKEFTAEAKTRVQKLRDAFAALSSFTATELEKTLKAVAGELGIKAGPLVHPVRLAVTGATSGPSLYHLLEIVGRDKVLQRMDIALR
jgi:glutamyl-tRNA synthetase